MSPTLNSLAPENVAHGSEILLQALGSSGGYTTIAEIFEMTYDVDQKLEALPILGTRRNAYRRGRLEVKGSIKAYYLNAATRSIWLGVATPSTAGSGPNLYESQIPFTRYNIIVQNANWPGASPSLPYLVLVNVTMEKDTVNWNADKFTTEDIAFFAEDVYGQ